MNSLPKVRNSATWIALIAILAIGLLRCTPSRMSEKDLSASFSTELLATQQQYKLGEPIELTFAVTCKTKSAKFCRYMTPLEGFSGNILEVKDAAGQNVEYIGPSKKRGKPGPEDYITLTGGNSTKATFDLQNFYPIKASGQYSVKFRGSKGMNQLPDSNVLEITVL
jgi:hypothetical protein